MSLFPAYSLDSSNKDDVIDVDEEPSEKSPEDTWLNNISYIDTQPSVPAPSKSTSKRIFKDKKKHKKKHRHDEKTESDLIAASTSVKPNSTDEFYTDNVPYRGYFSVSTLRKPARPRYFLSKYRFPIVFTERKAVKIKRYYVHFKKTKAESGIKRIEETSPKEKKFLAKLRDDSNDVLEWISYFRFKEANPVHLDSYQNSKSELEIIEKAMRYNPNNDELLQIYLETIVKVHPTDEVLELIQKLVSKDTNNFLLWSTLIYNKQSSMAQCIVPNVLKLYEKSMRTLFTAKKSDEVMLKLFKNCALFLRQSGLMEHFFALINLTINLNISPTFNNSKNIFHSPEHNTMLIEYEELILSSGLPMNEIWLRIEKLRSAFNYLPFLGRTICSDPQRIVINEDICAYVYPLINKEYSFDLFILILKMMKYPFESKVFEQESFFKPEPSENDQIEDMLALFLDVNRSQKIDVIIFSMIKELNSAPSFINTNLAYESYFNLMKEMIIAASEFCTEAKNIILVSLYLKLERILLILDKMADNLTDAKKKSCRSRIKNLLQTSKHQNNLNFYIEYGLIEYEIDGYGKGFIKIFETSVNMFGQSKGFHDDNDLYSLILKLVEILFKDNQKMKAISILTKLALSPNHIDISDGSVVPGPSKLLALQKFNDRVNKHMEEEKLNDYMLLEDYFKSNKLLNSIKAHLYYMALVKSKKETIDKVEKCLKMFRDKSNRKHFYLREQIYEIYLKILDFKFDEFSDFVFIAVIERVLEEYPHNLTAIKMCTFSESLSWFRMRCLLGRHLTSASVILLVCAARYRATILNEVSEFDCSQIDSNELTYKKRILNLLYHATGLSALKENSLLWRLYLRELFDQNNQPDVLDKCKKVLYAALEACPWNKSLYLDGAFFAPQELSQLLDLLIEKQLRIHAIPEELSILRNE